MRCRRESSRSTRSSPSSRWPSQRPTPRSPSRPPTGRPSRFASSPPPPGTSPTSRRPASYARRFLRFDDRRRSLTGVPAGGPVRRGEGLAGRPGQPAGAGQHTLRPAHGRCSGGRLQGGREAAGADGDGRAGGHAAEPSDDGRPRRPVLPGRGRGTASSTCSVRSRARWPPPGLRRQDPRLGRRPGWSVRSTSAARGGTRPTHSGSSSAGATRAAASPGAPTSSSPTCTTSGIGSTAGHGPRQPRRAVRPAPPVRSTSWDGRSRATPTSSWSSEAPPGGSAPRPPRPPLRQTRATDRLVDRFVQGDVLGTPRHPDLDQRPGTGRPEPAPARRAS